MPLGEKIFAVHYFYFLKEDSGDLNRLWSTLTASVAGAKHASPEMPPGEIEAAGQCQVIHRVRGGEKDFCLVMLADFAAIEVFYRREEIPVTGSDWREALAAAAADRALAAEQGISLFGETSVITAASREAAEAGLGAIIAGGCDEIPGPAPGMSTNIPVTQNGASLEPSPEGSGGGTRLASELDPALAGGGRPLLIFSIPAGNGGLHDCYALAAADPEQILSSALPEIDAAIKNLRRQSGYFAHQRHTIAGERAGIDKEVGGLLHRRVISIVNEPEGPERLEEMIASLSRMFGLLATDSLLMRSAEDRLRSNSASLESALRPRLRQAQDAIDEIGSTFLRDAAADLEDTRAEARNLSFSRQNAEAAIEVVRTQVELLRAGEEAVIQDQTRELLSRSLLVQQERLALQAAASLVEFVLVFYYVLKSWEGIAGQAVVEQTPEPVRLLLVALMSGGAAAGTHFLAQAIHSHSWKKAGLWISAAVLSGALAAMIIMTIVESG